MHQPMTFFTETFVIPNGDADRGDDQHDHRADIAEQCAHARIERATEEAAVGAERCVDDQKIGAGCAAEGRDHARHVDLEKHDRREQSDQQRKPAGGVTEERMQRGGRVQTEQTGMRGWDDERDGEQKRNAERNDPGDLVVPTRRHARLPANASHCHERLATAQRSPRRDRGTVIAVAPPTIVVLGGDQTGQELLIEALRVIAPEVIGLPIILEHFDLSLERRRETKNAVVLEAAAAMKRAKLGLKAATITPEGKGDVGSPNAIVRQAIDGKVIVRTGRRIPGRPAGGRHPRPDLGRAHGRR